MQNTEPPDGKGNIMAGPAERRLSYHLNAELPAELGF